MLVRTTTEEREERRRIVRTLHDRGLAPAEIARLTKITESTVSKDLTRCYREGQGRVAA